jgi:predicted RNase H-like HicB family nuclease
MRQHFTIVIERAPMNYSAYAPDVPGCITTGATLEETRRNMVEALTLHLEAMYDYGEVLPEPVTRPADVIPLTSDDVVTEVDIELPGPVGAPA